MNFKRLKMSQIMAEKRREKERILKEWSKSPEIEKMLDEVRKKQNITKIEDVPF
jgi:hypothetical protein